MILLKDRILVKKIATEENKTESGIILGNKPKTDNDFEVILIGKEVQNIKIGNVVRKYKNISGIPVEYNGDKCFILVESSEIEFIL